MKKAKKGQDASLAGTAQHDQEAMVAAAMRLPGVAEAFKAYTQAIQALPGSEPAIGLLYATDVNSASIG